MDVAINPDGNSIGRVLAADGQLLSVGSGMKSFPCPDFLPLL